MLLRLLFPFMLLAFSSGLLAQERPFEGYWTGYLTQEEGGFRPKYYFELRLQQQGNRITGASYASVEKIYAEFALEGEATGDQLTFKENRMIRYTRLEEMSWCFKWGTLKLVKKGKAWILEGNWDGKSPFGPCIPGKIYLVKTPPKV